MNHAQLLVGASVFGLMAFDINQGYAQPVVPGCPVPNSLDCVVQQGWQPSGTGTLSASSASSNVALPSTFATGPGAPQNLLVSNASSSVGAWIALGGVSVAATTAPPSIYVPAGQSIWIPEGTATYIAAITASGTAALTLTSGTGVPEVISAGGGGGGSGGSVTQGTSPWVVGGTVTALGTFSANVSPFAPNGTISSAATVTGTSAPFTLPANTGAVLFGNTGSLAVEVKLATGTTAATAADIVIPAGAEVAFGVGTNTVANMISSGTVVVNMAGGTGLLGGVGGSSSGGGAASTVTLAAGSASVGTIALSGTSPVTIANTPTVVVSSGTVVNNGGSVALSAGAAAIGTVAVSGTIPVSGTVATSGTNTVAGTVALSGTQTVAGFAGDIVNAVTRAANTTVYTANTGWNVSATGSLATGYFTFSGICPAAAKSVLIPQIGIGSSADPATKLAGNLFLFNTAPATLIADNATFTIAAGDWANLTAGSKSGIPFTLTNPTGNSGNPNSGVALTGLNVMAVCNSGTAAIYGVVEVTNAYTPASGEVLTIDISMIGQN